MSWNTQLAMSMFRLDAGNSLALGRLVNKPQGNFTGRYEYNYYNNRDAVSPIQVALLKLQKTATQNRVDTVNYTRATLEDRLAQSSEPDTDKFANLQNKV